MQNLPRRVAVLLSRDVRRDRFFWLPSTMELATLWNNGAFQSAATRRCLIDMLNIGIEPAEFGFHAVLADRGDRARLLHSAPPAVLKLFTHPAFSGWRRHPRLRSPWPRQRFQPCGGAANASAKRPHDQADKQKCADETAYHDLRYHLGRRTG
jgi:hypothetical protein